MVYGRFDRSELDRVVCLFGQFEQSGALLVPLVAVLCGCDCLVSVTSQQPGCYIRRIDGIRRPVDRCTRLRVRPDETKFLIFARVAGEPEFHV